MTLTSRPPVQSEDRVVKRSYVRDMFTAIAPRYDLLNHLLSFNVDRRWRRCAVDVLGWERATDGVYLDLCAGTLDLAAELAQREGFTGRVVGADFVLPMLALGRGKAPGLEPVAADALELPFADGSFDGVTIGFGVRNLVDVRAGLSEMARVLRRGARLVILEFSMPTRWPIRLLYRYYFTRVLPRVGRLVSKHTSAYSYLPDSVDAFPTPDGIAQHMRTAGFHDVHYRRLTFGISTIHVGTRG